jgi:hypothetical protein
MASWEASVSEDKDMMMSERENYCENCVFVQRRELDSVSLVFGWCNIPLPPHIYQWAQRLSEQAVAPKYSCALFQPALSTKGQKE